MKKSDIITLPNPDLRVGSKKVKIIDEKIKQLVLGMEEATLDWEDSRDHEVGVALAAVQLDQLYRVVVIRNDFDNKKDRGFYCLINPKIIQKSGDIKADYEGCLSITDIYGMVPRYSKVKVRGLDIDGNELTIKADGFLARVLQHEIDHTNGIVFIDHIKNTKDAFYKLNSEGKLEPLDYDEHIKSNNILW